MKVFYRIVIFSLIVTLLNALIAAGIGFIFHYFGLSYHNVSSVSLISFVALFFFDFFIIMKDLSK